MGMKVNQNIVLAHSNPLIHRNDRTEGGRSLRSQDVGSSAFSETKSDREPFSFVTNWQSRKEPPPQNKQHDKKKMGAFRLVHLLQLFYDELSNYVNLLNTFSPTDPKADSHPQEAGVVIKQEQLRLAKMFSDLSLELEGEQVMASNPTFKNLLLDIKDLWNVLSHLYLSLKKQTEAGVMPVTFLNELVLNLSQLEAKFLTLVENDVRGTISGEKINHLKQMLAESPRSMVKTQEDVPLSITFTLLS